MLLKEKEKIEEWLNTYEVENYVLIEDQKYGYVVNVYDCVNLYNKDLKNIEVKFNEVEGNFTCNNNQLESFEGFPKIITGDLYCSKNNMKLDSLNHFPKNIVAGYVDLNMNPELNNFQSIKNFSNLKLEIDNYLMIKSEKEKINNVINKKEDKKIIINKV